MANVATTKIFESDSIIVWEMVLTPGEGTGVHTHHHDYMFYATQGSTLEIQDENGKHIDTITINTGDVLEFKIDGNSLRSSQKDKPIIPVTHQAYNRGNQDYTEVLVEQKRS